MPGQATDERSRPPEPLFHFLRNRCSTSSGFRVPLPPEYPSYATVNRVTAIPATYVPAPTARNEAVAERWAAQMEKPGGMAEVSRDITSVEMAYRADRVSTQREMRKERTEERNQEQQQTQQQSIAGHKPVQPGGDPAVGTPAARPAPGAAAPAQTQERDQAQPSH